MRLRWRFTLWFAVAAIVPIGGAAIATHEVLSKNYRERFERRRENVVRSLQRELEQRESAIVGVVTDLASRDDPYVGGALLELHKNEGDIPDVVQRLIAEQGRNWLASSKLDVLILADDQGVVLDSPHHRALEGEVDASLTHLDESAAPRAVYRKRRMLRDGRIREMLVVEANARVRDGRYSLAVAGGTIVGQSVVAGVRGESAFPDGRLGARRGPNADAESPRNYGASDEVVDARVVDAEGMVLVDPLRPWQVENQVRLPLPGHDGKAVAWLEIAVNDNEKAVIAQVTALSVGFAVAGLLVTVLLGFVVARRMTGDLDFLVEGAQAASRLELAHQVPIRRRDEIGEVARAMNFMMEELADSKERLVMAERVAAWQEIARRLAHEIKNPLTPIQMSVETLRRTRAMGHPSFDEIFEESTATVLEEAARLKRIVAEFSEFARMPKLVRVFLDLNDLLASQLSLYQGTLTVEKDFDNDLPLVYADRDAMVQLVLNLFENAREAVASRGREGRVVVRTRQARQGRVIQMIIEDNGPGFSEETRERLFTPYFTTKHASAGTGLGLAIVHRIVTDHGGRIHASRSKLGGACFTVDVPSAAVHPDEVTRKAASPPVENGG